MSEVIIMNRENKRKKYDKNYFKKHKCTDSFICKVCGVTVVSQGAGSCHRNHCLNCLSSVHLDTPLRQGFKLSWGYGADYCLGAEK